MWAERSSWMDDKTCLTIHLRVSRFKTSSSSVIPITMIDRKGGHGPLPKIAVSNTRTAPRSGFRFLSLLGSNPEYQQEDLTLVLRAFD